MIIRRNYDKLSDTELIEMYREDGNKQLVGELYKRYTGFAFAVCLKYLRSRVESEDAVMQIFEKLIDDLKVHSVQNFKAWLYIVAKNHCLHIIRNQKHKHHSLDLNQNILPHIMENFHNMYHDNENVLDQRLEDMERELHNLSEEQRICVELFYLKQKSYTEVAQLTGYSVNQVKSYIQNGKRNLRISLKGDEK